MHLLLAVAAQAQVPAQRHEACHIMYEFSKKCSPKRTRISMTRGTGNILSKGIVKIRKLLYSMSNDPDYRKATQGKHSVSHKNKKQKTNEHACAKANTKCQHNIRECCPNKHEILQSSLPFEKGIGSTPRESISKSFIDWERTSPPQSFAFCTPATKSLTAASVCSGPHKVPSASGSPI